MFLSWQESVGADRAAKIQQQLAEQAIAAACKHCWHDTGMTLTSYPPQSVSYCCHCDTRKTETMRMQSPDGHGKFLRKQPF